MWAFFGTRCICEIWIIPKLCPPVPFASKSGGRVLPAPMGAPPMLHWPYTFALLSVFFPLYFFDSCTHLTSSCHIVTGIMNPLDATMIEKQTKSSSEQHRQTQTPIHLSALESGQVNAKTFPPVVKVRGRGGWAPPLQLLAPPQFLALPHESSAPHLLYSDCKKFGHFVMKIIEFVATRCQILRLKCTKFNFGWGSAPDPAARASALPQIP